jgi:hypothetical protein
VPRIAALLALLVALLVAACGGDDGNERPAARTQKEPAAPKVEFPKAEGQTLTRLRRDTPQGPVFAPSTSVMRVGANRIGFALFDEARTQVTPEAVALYTAKPDGSGLRGPYMAKQQSLEVKPQFQSRQTAADADEVDQFWTARVPFPKRGRYIVTALANVDGKLVSTTQFELRAGTRGGPPEVGEKAVKVSTPTPADVGGDLSQIDTRLPPLRELHEVDLADALGKRPVVLAFATPQLCQTQVCGPVVDVAAEVQSRTQGVDFIHMEIYRDNDLKKGFRPQVGAWRLPTEPWVFVIDRSGKVVERFEGALSVAELARAVSKVGKVSQA